MRVLTLFILLHSQVIENNGQNRTTVTEKSSTVETEITMTDSATQEDRGFLDSLDIPIIRDALAESELVRNSAEFNGDIPVDTKINPDVEIPINEEASTRNVQNHNVTTPENTEAPIDKTAETASNAQETSDNGVNNSDNSEQINIERLTAKENELQNKTLVIGTLLVNGRLNAENSETPDTTLNKEPLEENVEHFSTRRMMPELQKELEYKGRSAHESLKEHENNLKHTIYKGSPSYNQDHFDSRSNQYQYNPKSNISEPSEPYWPTISLPRQHQTQIPQENIQQNDQEWILNQKTYSTHREVIPNYFSDEQFMENLDVLPRMTLFGSSSTIPLLNRQLRTSIPFQSSMLIPNQIPLLSLSPIGIPNQNTRIYLNPISIPNQSSLLSLSPVGIPYQVPQLSLNPIAMLNQIPQKSLNLIGIPKQNTLLNSNPTGNRNQISELYLNSIEILDKNPQLSLKPIGISNQIPQLPPPNQTFIPNHIPPKQLSPIVHAFPQNLPYRQQLFPVLHNRIEHSFGRPRFIGYFKY